jgi:hypothetical protein
MAHAHRLLVLFLVLMVGLTACSGRLTNMSQTDDFNIEEMLESPWAIAGVVLSPRLDPDRVAQQEIRPLQQTWQGAAEFYSPMLYGAFVERVPQMELWTFDSVYGQMPEAELKILLEGYARSRVFDSDDFQSVVQALPRVRYLVFARLDGTEIETRQDAPTREEDQRVKDGRDPHGGSLSRSVFVRRSALMTLQVYDLADGRMLWSGSVESWKDELFNSGESIQDSGAIVAQDSPEGGKPEISIEGTPMRTPALAKVVDQVCSDLVRKLIPD